MSDAEDRLFKGPEGTALRFYYKPQKNNFISEREGIAIFDKVLFVEVMTPGATESMPVFELEREFCEQAGLPVRRNEAKCMAYAEPLASFKAGNLEATVQGTPLTQWPAIDIHLAETLKAMRIHTVEQLATVSDTSLRHIGTGARALRAQAQAFVAKAGEGHDLAGISARLAALETENERLKSELATALAPREPGTEAAPAAPLSNVL